MSLETLLRKNYFKIKKLGIKLNDLNAIKFRGNFK